MKRILGIDFGSKRIGIAISDESRKFALPVTVLESSDYLLDGVKKLMAQYETDEIVLGESRNFKGEPNPILLKSMDFKDELEKSGFIVHFEPEFMTSQHAERFQGKTDKLDASAAALILQSFLDRSKIEKEN